VRISAGSAVVMFNDPWPQDRRLDSFRYAVWELSREGQVEAHLTCQLLEWMTANAALNAAPGICASASYRDIEKLLVELGVEVDHVHGLP
jgi:hypothetical protein